MKTTPKTETVRYPTLFRRNSHQSVEFRRGVRWGRWPIALCQNASLLAALWARKLAGFDGDLVGEQRPTITATIAMFFLPVTRNAATAMVIF